MIYEQKTADAVKNIFNINEIAPTAADLEFVRAVMFLAAAFISEFVIFITRKQYWHILTGILCKKSAVLT